MNKAEQILKKKTVNKWKKFSLTSVLSDLRQYYFISNIARNNFWNINSSLTTVNL